MGMTVKKAKLLLVLSTVLLLTLVGTTGASAKTIQRHTFIPLPIYLPFPPAFIPVQYLVFPMLTAVGDSNQSLDENGCFMITLQGRYFSHSHDDDEQYADLYAYDSYGDALTVDPWSVRVHADGEFTRDVSVCGVSSGVDLVSIVAVDDATGASSEPVMVGISS